MRYMGASPLFWVLPYGRTFAESRPNRMQFLAFEPKLGHAELYQLAVLSPTRVCKMSGFERMFDYSGAPRWRYIRYIEDQG